MILTPAQNTIAADEHRFRVLNCGRRFGKTSLAIEEIKGKALGKPAQIAYLAPTIQQARDIAWEAIKRELRSVAVSIKEAPSLEMRVRTIAGGESTIKLRGWEAVETQRGQSFDFLVIDEVASMRNFWVGWNEVLSPTLTDRRGEALFISTPKGFNHFYDLFNKREKDEDYASFQFSTYDNPHIPVDEIERERRSKPEDAFAQEYLADFRKRQGLVYPEFNRIKHVYREIPEGTGFQETVAGVDFGFVHPAAVEVLKLDNAGGIWVTPDELYRTHMTDLEIAEYVAALPGINRVFPDPESPSAIEDMRRKGVNVRQVVKGKDSEKHGIDKIRELLKADKLHIHVDCVGLIGEFETHAYRDGKDEPEETGEDALDALRYPIMMIQPQAKQRETITGDEGTTYSQIGI